MDEIERKRTDKEPEQNALRERSPADIFERAAGDAGADEKECGGESELAECKEFLRKGRVLRTESVDDRGEKEKQDEPGNSDFGFSAFHCGREKSERYDPKCARKFYCRCNDKRFRTVTRSGADYGTCVMNR